LAYTGASRLSLVAGRILRATMFALFRRMVATMAPRWMSSICFVLIMLFS
jgi:hypothetical protein